MSGLAWATWAAIVILVAGSSAIFVWFLFDARGLLRGAEERPKEPDDTP